MGYENFPTYKKLLSTKLPFNTDEGKKPDKVCD